MVCFLNFTLLLGVRSSIFYSNFGHCNFEYRGELSLVSFTAMENLSKPVAYIYNLNKNEVTEFIIGVYIITWMCPMPKIRLFEVQAPGKFSHQDKMRAIYNAYAERDELMKFFDGTWPKEAEIVLRGSHVLQNLLQLIKNPPNQIVVSDEAREIEARFHEIFMDADRWFNGTLSNNMKTMDCVLGSMLWIYSHQRKENLTDLPEFLRDVRKKIESDYDERLCAEVRRRLDLEHSTLYKKYEEEVLAIREEIVAKRKDELSKSVIKEVYDETKRMKTSTPIEVLKRSGSEDNSGCVIS